MNISKKHTFILIIIFSIVLSGFGYTSYRLVYANQQISQMKRMLDTNHQVKMNEALIDEVAALQQEIDAVNADSQNSVLQNAVLQALMALYDTNNDKGADHYVSSELLKEQKRDSANLLTDSHLTVSNTYYHKESATHYDVIAICRLSTSPPGSGSSSTTNLLCGFAMEMKSGNWKLTQITLEKYFNQKLDKFGGSYE